MSGLSIATAGLVGLVARATLVLCLALLVAWLARRGSARTLHLLWTTTFVVLLALPVVSLLGPSWSVPVLPVRHTGVDRLSVQTTAQEAAATGAARETPGSSISSASPRRITGSTAAYRSTAGNPSSSVESSLPRPGAMDVPAALSPSAIAYLIWALGCGAALTSLVVGGLRFRKLVRKAVPVRDPSWLRQVDSIRRRMRIQGDLRVLLSAEATTPMTGGLRRPVILLPYSAGNWMPDRREVVLAHELVHVRRHDALRQLLGRAAAACYWFHPLGWLAVRLSAVAGERSCDEEVLALGTRPSEYARHLFSLASETAGHPAALLALRMVQRSQLENRIMSILKQHRPRYSPARTSAALAVMGATGLLIACANPVPRDPDAQPSPQVETTVSSDAQAQDRAIRAPSQEPTPAATLLPQPEPPESAATQPVATAPAVPEAIDRPALECKFSVIPDPESTTLRTTVDGIQLCMRSRGGVVMTKEGAAVESMDASSWLLLESKAERIHRLVITSGPDGFEYDWSIDGRAQPFDAEAREWRDRMFIVVQRSHEAQQIRGREAGLRGRIATHRGWIATLQGRIASHRWHVATLQSQIASLMAHVAGLHAQMASARARAIRVQGSLGAVWKALDRIHGVAGVYVQDLTQSLEAVDSEGASRGARWPQAANAARETLQALSQNLQQLGENLETLDQAYQDSTERADRDLEVRLTDLEEQIEEYDLDGRIREVEIQIQEYDLDGKIAEIEALIEEYDPDGRIRDIEAQIEALDADRRVDEIERLIQDDIAALRRLIG